MSTDLENKTVEKSRLDKKGKIVILSCVGALVVLAVIIGALMVVPADTIVKGVYVDKLNLGGMTQKQAEAAIADWNFNDGVDKLTVKSGSHEREIAFSDIAMAIDAEAIAQSAFAICHTENKLTNAFQAFKLKFSRETLPVMHKADTLKIDTILAEFGNEIFGKLREHEVTLPEDSDKLVINPGVTGCCANFETARGEIFASVATLDYDDVEISITTEAPKPLDVDSLANSIYTEPKDAEFSVKDNRAQVVPHVVGVQLDKNDATNKLSQLVEGGTPIEISVIRTMPEITQSVLEAKLFNSTLSSFSTRYNPGAVNRSKNVAIAANRINGYIMAPGDVFSYNEVVGRRTVANGFLNAPVYENGKSVDGIGGGVCQVSTTLYSAVLYGDFEVVSRQNHSMPVAYAPLGQDATVVDGAIDFQFKNNTNYPIKIVASASKGTMSVSIVGTKREVPRTVKLNHTILSQVPPTVKETMVAELPTGTRVVAEKGKTGYVVSSTKYVYENGQLIETKSLGKSTYKMVPEQVNVGTGPAVAVVAPVETPPQTNVGTAVPAVTPAPEVTAPPTVQEEPAPEPSLETEIEEIVLE